ALASALGLAALGAAPAFADRYAIDEDSSAGMQHMREVTVAPGATVDLRGRLIVIRSGGNHLAAGTVTFRLDKVENAPANLHADDVVVSIPTSWATSGQSAEGTYHLTFTAPASGSQTTVLKWAPVADYGNDLTGSDNLLLK